MFRLLAALWVGLGLIPTPSTALTEVDVELFLAVDVSRSMSRTELEIQRRGYAEALASDEVFAAVQGGMLGRVALTYVEWAGNFSHNVVVPWTLIETREQAQEFAAKLQTIPAANMRRTSISGALEFAASDILENDFIGLRAIIDISGDGPNNQGRPVWPVRNEVVEHGIIINGLPLMTNDNDNGRWHIDDLDVYYRECVIGGPGAFVVPVYSWSQFAEAVKRKLILEIAHVPTRVVPVQFNPPSGYDCMIGEKIRIRRMEYWDEF